MLAMTTFQRARSEEQREVRRRAILDAAAAMLAEMPVAEVTLNELSRRVGLAKSNVLRYFESREAVLLELLDSAWQEWLTGLEADLGGRDRRRPRPRPGGVISWPPRWPRRWPPGRCCATCSARRPRCWSGTSPRRSPPPTSGPPWRTSPRLGHVLLRHLGELGEPDAERLGAGPAPGGGRGVGARPAVGRRARGLRG